MTQRSWAPDVESDAPAALRCHVPVQRSPRRENAVRVPRPRSASPTTAALLGGNEPSWAPDPWSPLSGCREGTAAEGVGARGLAAWTGNLVAALVVLAFLGLAIGPQTGAYRTTTMLTGSMRPAYPPGSVLVVTPQSVDDLAAGQVITFHAPLEDRRVVTHRVVSVDRTGPRPVMITKGDANAGVDPWQATVTEDTVWRVRFVVPVVGRAIQQLREPWAQVVLTRALPALLLVSLLVAVWRPERRDD